MLGFLLNEDVVLPSFVVSLIDLSQIIKFVYHIDIYIRLLNIYVFIWIKLYIARFSRVTTSLPINPLTYNRNCSVKI